jgi:hypothetical protein
MERKEILQTNDIKTCVSLILNEEDILLLENKNGA